MGRRTIQIIIILMSVALVGITVIQFYWLKNGIDINGENFDNQVRYALNRVKQSLEDDAKELENLTSTIGRTDKASIFKQSQERLDKILSPNIDDYRRKQLETQVANIPLIIRPELSLNSISAADLSKYLRVELQNQGIDLNYDFGIYSNKIEGYTLSLIHI